MKKDTNKSKLFSVTSEKPIDISKALKSKEDKAIKARKKRKNKK